MHKIKRILKIIGGCGLAMIIVIFAGQIIAFAIIVAIPFMGWGIYVALNTLDETAKRK